MPKISGTGSPALTAGLFLLGWALPLGAMVLKPPPPYPMDTVAQEAQYLVNLLPGEEGSPRNLMAFFSNYVAQTVKDREGGADRTTLVISARERIRVLIHSVREVRPPLAEVPLRGFEEMWQRCDGDILEVMERCRLSFRQGVWAAQIMCDFRDEQISRSVSFPSIFPAGEEGTMLENALDPGQRAVYRKLKMAYEADLGRRRAHRPGKEEIKAKRKEVSTPSPIF